MPELTAAPTAQLRRLLVANRQAVEHLDLAVALRRIVEAAVEMVGAEGGALAVLGRDGLLDHLVHTGLTEDAAARLVDQPDDGVLGVPLQVRDEVFGHLHLVAGGAGAFSPDDRALVEALAGTAGVAISHARLFDESTRREQWTAATSEITHELLTNESVDALQLVAERVRELAVARSVAVVLTRGAPAASEELVVARAAGEDADGLRGRALTSGDHLVRACLAARRPQLAESMPPTPVAAPPGHDDTSVGSGPAMVVPLAGGQGVRGAILVVRPAGATHFVELDLDVAASLAGHAALALDRADARTALALSRTREDRDRIARDLHDHTIQRLFAVGLTLESVRGALGATVESDLLGEQVGEIDATIRQIRTTIFSLGASGRATGLRALVLEVVAGAAGVLPEVPAVTFQGPVDLLVARGMHGDASAVLREALANVGRHAEARHVAVSVTATPAELVLVVHDDGRGIAAGARRSGLENLRRRAEARGGRFEVSDHDDGPGTRLCWAAPLEDEET